jgi:hypothetical protein
MNPPRCDDLDYIHFLIAAQRAFTCTEAARCQPGKPDAPAHDAFTRLLRRSPPDTEALWKEAGAVVKLEGGVLLVDPDRSGNRPVEEVEVPPEGCVVHLKGYGMVKVFRAFSKDGDAEYWATDDLEMLEEEREALPSQGWGIEAYHRGLKQCCGIERAQGRGARAQLNHLAYSIRAFIRLEAHRLRRGISWYEAKASIIREAIRAYLAKPIFTLAPTA